jgi:Ca2+-binding RTX toxin-like protein
LAGNDTISSLAGNDIINGGAGADTMMGGKGDDEYYVDNVGDVVKERDYEGEDAVYTTVSYGLSTNVENIVLMGTVAITGTGNKLNNHLTGNGAGSTLDGLGGDDNYYVSRAGDIIAESAGNGWDTVISSINYTLENNIEELYLTGTGHLNGTGNAQGNNLHGNKGDNILDGGKGDDYLQGMNGADTLIGGLGKDSYDLAETTAATDTVGIAKGDSLVSSYDVATGFKLGTNSVDTAGVDKLDLDSTDIAADAVAVNGSNSGNIKSHHISEGIISFDDSNYYTHPVAITDANLANVFSYLQANITGHDTVAFVSEGNTFVFQDGGAVDTLVELVGVTAHSVNTTGLGAGALWIA